MMRKWQRIGSVLCSQIRRSPLCLRSNTTCLFSTSTSSIPSRSEGLFMVPGLHKPSDFRVLSNRAIKNCNELLATLDESNSRTSSQTLEILDQISNEVCSVIDAAEVCRNIHAKEEYRMAADDVFNELAAYINSLNSNMTIYNHLKSIVSTSIHSTDTQTRLTAEETILATDMLHELETEGIHIQDDENKIKLMTLQRSTVSLEGAFLQNISSWSSSIGNVYKLGPLSPWQYEQIRNWLASQGIPQDDSEDSYTVTMCSNPRVSGAILRVLDKEELRATVWHQSRKEPAANIKILGELVFARQKLAHLLGFQSFLHKSLSRKVLTTPRKVLELLEATGVGVAEQGDTDVMLLQSVKSTLLDMSHGKKAASSRSRIYSNKLKKKKRLAEEQQSTDCVEVFPWDESFLMDSYQSSKVSERGEDGTISKPRDSLRDFLSVTSCMHGLRYVCGKIFGIDMKFEEISSNEKWTHEEHDDDLIKCSLWGPQGEGLGYIYFDLYTRPDKFSGAAHFTTRCGCSNLSPSMKHDGADGCEQQLPVIVLVLNLPRQNEHLDLQQLESLYHEMGHALHSLLSRTKFQHLSGTRGSTDFVEVPSHLFEFFARDPSVIQAWARKYPETRAVQKSSDIPGGQPPPLELIKEEFSYRCDFAAIEIQNQLLYALVDQYIFGPKIMQDYQERFGVDNDLHDGIDHTLLYELIEDFVSKESKDLSLSPTISINVLQLTHLVNYGGAYYSYLFAKMHAAQIWERRFAADPLSREAGKALWLGLLQYGAARNPSELLQELGNGPLEPRYYLNNVAG